MVFSSSLFILYFLPAFLIWYHITPKEERNYVVLIASILFYSWGAPMFVFAVLGSTFANFHLVRYMDKSAKTKNKKLLLYASIGLNLSLLLYFKYANFFVDNFNTFISNFGYENVRWTAIALPIGISFFTFQSLTYTIDVFRGVSKPLKKASDYILYILLFPQMIAGPIVRFNTIANQILDRSEYDTINYKLSGAIRFSIGLGKKVLIANVMGQYADEIFAMGTGELDTGLAWLGVVCYSFQIYFDFSGYSDMAIGIGKILGFTFPENFNCPYISRNITEFWRRWHITLGTWMRDYLYIPLGGNKVSSKRRLYFNLWIVFIISGLWHGSAWTFVIWGVYHGLFLILDRLFLIKFFDKIGKWPSILINYIIVLFSWVVFRSEDFDSALQYSQKMLSFDFNAHLLFYNREVWGVLFIAFFFSFFPAFSFGQKLVNNVFNKDYNLRQYIVLSFASIILLILSISSITTSGFNPFIYFRF